MRGPALDRYRIVVAWSDEAFIADVPARPGCVFDGATYAEATAHAEDAARAWVETAIALGRDVPAAHRSTLA